MPVPMDNPVLVEYMLQYLYGLDYMEEPGEDDDLSKWSKKKRSSKLQSRRREQLEAQQWPDNSFGPYEEGPTASEVESDYSKGVSSGGNAAVHAQMCAIADFYGVPDLQKVAAHFRSDAVLRDIMVDKIATDNNLLDEQEVEEILQKDGELALAIAKHMR
ncbi:uncharacterized protein KY384_003269 [Bacidia gigantensis]|uniref:uncharacterized protein n=1 Tax=Bacidia gigantensis TaxID=2732470 RepID=UPI001D036BC7|nr:uncharacterized protein KY384_003269 [Bacidia gigantensis]KAG8531638.1 hypothetical protein KY384_003269 [Bacidia gigantensis]